MNGKASLICMSKEEATFSGINLSPGLTAGGSDGSFAIALFRISINPMERTLFVFLRVILLFVERNEITAVSATSMRIN